MRFPQMLGRFVFTVALLFTPALASAQGQGWTLLPLSGCTNLKQFVLASDTELWVACRTLGAYHSTDTGQSWATVNAGFVAGFDNIEVRSTPVGLMAVSLSTTGDGIYHLARTT